MKQNQHIARSMETAHRAVCRLMRMNLTVLDVHVGEATPRIEILPGRETAKLDGAVSLIRGNRHGRREVTKTARLEGAYVQWSEPA